MKVRKKLAEALILSKINYCNVVHGQLPKYLINRLQWGQNTKTGYVWQKAWCNQLKLVTYWEKYKNEHC